MTRTFASAAYDAAVSGSDVRCSRDDSFPRYVLPRASVRRRFDHQRRGSIAFDPAGQHRRLPERFGPQTLHGVTPQRGDRPNVHGPGFAAGARERFRCVQNTELRPLGAGEILDRAVTLFVRRFVPIVTVLAVVIVPLVILETIASPGSARVFDDLGKAMAAGTNRTASKQALDALTRDGQTSPLAYLLMIAGMFARLLMFSAVVAVIASTYAGEPLAFAAGYRLAFRRWGTQIVVALVYAALAVIAAIPLFMAALALALVASVLAVAGSQAVTAVVSILGVLVFLGLVMALSGWLYMAYMLAAVAVVTERSDVATAVGAGLRRAFGKPTRWRTLIAGLVAAAITFGGSLPTVGVAIGASALLHLPVLYYAIVGAGSVLLEGLTTAFVVVYATDVRVRREGLDLVPQPLPA